LGFAGGLREVYVIEERRGFLEEQVTEIVNRARQDAAARGADLAVAVWGKRFPRGCEGIPSTRGLSPSKLIGRLGPLFLGTPGLEGRVDRGRIQRELDLIREVKSVVVDMPARTPTFCPGCPHRDSASVLIELKKQFRDELYMGRVHGTGPVDVVFHGDTGCYTMLMFEPTKDLMHNYSGMGLGGGTGAGIDPFIRNKQVVFMGDSTFFHSGQIAISNSIKNGQDITYIVLDNKTTAMTGHQGTPGCDEGLLGERTFAQSIDSVIAGITDRGRSGATVVRVNPAERETYRALLEKTILQDGVKVVVADKECGITFHRREARAERAVVRERGFVPEKSHINITPEVCENCLECTKATGCPGLTLEETPYGRKVQIDQSWCVADGACTRFLVAPGLGQDRVKACPSFEEVRVRRVQAAPGLFDRLDFADLPLPAAAAIEGHWHGYLAGVGGMGIGTATAILVLAGHREGYGVRFCDKKGLAIRNGGVYSMITYAAPGGPYGSNVIPYGKADLLVGVDVLEATRALDPASNQRVVSRQRTAVVVNTHKTPTILTLLGRDDFQVAGLEEVLRRNSRPGAYYSCNVSEISEKYFGTQLYANMVMLGVAFQRGWLPLRLASLEEAIRTGLGAAAEENRKAFQLGRLMAHDLRAVERAAGLYREATTTAEVVAEKAEILARRGRAGAGRAAGFEGLVREAEGRWVLDGRALAEYARRVYDLIQFEDERYARVYADAVARVQAADRAEFGFEATKAVIWNLHKVMLIKDEVYVAHLLTSEEKRRRDRARYGVDPVRGDRIDYRHLTRPQITVFGRSVAFDIVTRDWMLEIVKRMRWLRRALPDWHRPEREFRDWYLDLLPRFAGVVGDAAAYEAFVRVLRLPEGVTGYREIRYPKLAAARRQAEVWLAGLERGETAERVLMSA
jgi:indolepyruvate ferredoxin oxidoreductase